MSSPPDRKLSFGLTTPRANTAGRGSSSPSYLTLPSNLSLDPSPRGTSLQSFADRSPRSSPTSPGLEQYRAARSAALQNLAASSEIHLASERSPRSPSPRSPCLLKLAAASAEARASVDSRSPRSPLTPGTATSSNFRRSSTSIPCAASGLPPRSPQSVSSTSRNSENPLLRANTLLRIASQANKQHQLQHRLSASSISKSPTNASQFSREADPQRRGIQGIIASSMFKSKPTESETIAKQNKLDTQEGNTDARRAFAAHSGKRSPSSRSISPKHGTLSMSTEALIAGKERLRNGGTKANASGTGSPAKMKAPPRFCSRSTTTSTPSNKLSCTTLAASSKSTLDRRGVSPGPSSVFSDGGNTSVSDYGARFCIDKTVSLQIPANESDTTSSVSSVDIERINIFQGRTKSNTSSSDSEDEEITDLYGNCKSEGQRKSLAYDDIASLSIRQSERRHSGQIVGFPSPSALQKHQKAVEREKRELERERSAKLLSSSSGTEQLLTIQERTSFVLRKHKSDSSSSLGIITPRCRQYHKPHSVYGNFGQ